jgi:hypothetical protein
MSVSLCRSALNTKWWARTLIMASLVSNTVQCYSPDNAIKAASILLLLTHVFICKKNKMREEYDAGTVLLHVFFVDAPTPQ